MSLDFQKFLYFPVQFLFFDLSLNYLGQCSISRKQGFQETLQFQKIQLHGFICSCMGQKKIKYNSGRTKPSMQLQQAINPVIIGYYPVRAKAQLCRLLCEYLHVPYIDQHLNPNQWDDYKHNQAKNWIIKDLPFLVDGDFVVTGSTGCSYYLIEKAGRLDLYGRNIEDNIKITTYGNRKDLVGAVIGLICKVKTNRTHEQIKQLKQYFAAKIEPILNIHQKEAKQNDWYLGYISLMDFILYLVMTQLDQTFPQEIKKFNKLNALKEKVLNIPQIYNYQNSQRVVKCYNPVEYFNSFKKQMMKSVPNSKFVKMSSKQMDIE